MTPAQESKHWHEWKAVVDANHWKTIKSRLVDEALITRDHSDVHRKVWIYALQLAMAANRAVTPNDLRHGSVIAALGTDKSHTEFTTGEFTKVLALWAVLCDPDNLDARMNHDDPKIGERRGLVKGILKMLDRQGYGEGYVIAITKSKHDTTKWRDLGKADGRDDLRDLRRLYVTVKEAMKKKTAKRALVNQPF
jgi:hypothetical protein